MPKPVKGEIKCPFVCSNKIRIVVITKIDILNSDVTEVIGQPIEYNEWLANVKI